MYFTGLVFLSGIGKSISRVKNSWNKLALFSKSAKSIYNNVNHFKPQKWKTLYKAFLHTITICPSFAIVREELYQCKKMVLTHYLPSLFNYILNFGKSLQPPRLVIANSE